LASRISWARLLKRVFEVGVGHWSNSAGELKIIAAIPERAVVEMILAHRGLQV
jgi:hypothetical protein